MSRLRWRLYRLQHRWRTRWRWKLRIPKCWIKGHRWYDVANWNGMHRSCSRCHKKMWFTHSTGPR